MGEQILVVCNFDEEQEITGLPDYGYLFGNAEKRNANGSYAPFETAVFVRSISKEKDI